MYACRGGHQQCVETLVNAGADINKSGTKGLNPLLCATKSGNISIVDFLLKNPNINVNVTDEVKKYLIL